MFETLKSQLELYYPFLLRDVVKITQSGPFELTIKRGDGTSWYYDDLRKSFGQLPSDSSCMSENDFRRDFGRRVRRLMLLRGITHEELSNRTGIHRVTITKYITGKYTPSFYMVDKIAKALGCSIDELRYCED